jgi:hypothetical protein
MAADKLAGVTAATLPGTIQAFPTKCESESSSNRQPFDDRRPDRSSETSPRRKSVQAYGTGPDCAIGRWGADRHAAAYGFQLWSKLKKVVSERTSLRFW